MIRGPIRYLIGAENPRGETGCVTVIAFDSPSRERAGTIVQYGNLLDEKYSARRYGPYARDQSGTPEEWGEGRIDSRGKGWKRNLNDQIVRAKEKGISLMEWDNWDSYHVAEILDALDLSLANGISVLAKNPTLVEGDRVKLMMHQSIVGAIVEAGAGTCDGMQELRVTCGKPLMPVWFVCNKTERAWARTRADAISARKYLEMGVTWCPSGDDYSEFKDILKPTPA